jgi:hypothetical protein
MDKCVKVYGGCVKGYMPQCKNGIAHMVPLHSCQACDAGRMQKWTEFPSVTYCEFAHLKHRI